MTRYYSETLGVDLYMSDEDFSNHIKSCTDEQRKSIVGMAISLGSGSDSYIMYIREVSEDGKLIKICRDMNEEEVYEDAENNGASRRNKVWVSYNWEHWFLRTRRGNKVYLQRDIRDNFYSFEEASAVIYKPKYDKKFNEYRSLNFNEAKEYRDPSF